MISDDPILSGTQLLLALATIISIFVATRITLRYAHRPDGMVNQYGQAQTVRPDGMVALDQYGTPIPQQVQAPRPEEKPMWVIWGQMFIVCELAAILVVAILTGGFGVIDALFGQAG